MNPKSTFERERERESCNGVPKQKTLLIVPVKCLLNSDTESSYIITLAEHSDMSGRIENKDRFLSMNNYILKYWTCNQ